MRLLMGLLAQFVQVFFDGGSVCLGRPTAFGGSVYNMVKCFWCGAENKRHQDSCCVCKRKLQWTTFFKGVLRPSVGCLLGSDSPVVARHGARLRLA
jgi:hypothetical protein